MSSYKLDLHVHTKNVSPCSQVDAPELVHLYQGIGYAGVVITDHYYDRYFNGLTGFSWPAKIDCFLTGYRQALATGQKIGLDVLWGMEIRFTESDNDYLVYGIGENFLKENPRLYNLSLVQFRELIRHQNIPIYQAHPFRPGMSLVHPELIDGIEVFNGNCQHDSRNSSAFEFAQKNNIKMISGSDFHRPQDLGRGGISTSEKITSSTELVKALQNSHTIQLLGI